MGVLIEIPSALKQYVNNQDEVEVDGSSVEEALDSLCAQFTELKPNLFDGDERSVWPNDFRHGNN